MCRDAEPTMPSVLPRAPRALTDGTRAPENLPLGMFPDCCARLSTGSDHRGTLDFAGASRSTCGTHRSGRPLAADRLPPCAIGRGMGEVAPSPRTVHIGRRPRRTMCSGLREILL